jgi:hypothetical protein
MDPLNHYGTGKSTQDVNIVAEFITSVEFSVPLDDILRRDED